MRLRAILSAAVAAIVAAVLLTGSAPAAATGPELRILRVGDSITAGKGSADGAGYATEADALLTWSGVPHTIVTQALVGATTADILPTLRQTVAATQPDVVLLDIGTNDAAQSAASIQAFEANFARCLSEIFAGKPNTVILPAYVQYSTAPTWLRANEAVINSAIYRQAYPGVGPYTASQIPAVVDLRVLPDGYIGGDGVHPTPDGHAAMGWLWYQAIALWRGLPATP